MATKIINLSGRGGLAKKWGGDFVRRIVTGKQIGRAHV